MDSDKMELISGFSSLIAAGAAVLTLFTVYVAATQIATRRQTYQLGLSTTSLGGWKDAIVPASIWVSLGITTQVRTPVITFPKLVRNKWEPNVELRAFNTSDTDIHARKMTRFVRRRKFSWLSPLMAAPQAGPAALSDTELEALQLLEEEKYLEAERPETTWVDFLQVLGIHPAAAAHYNPRPIYELQPEPELCNGIVPMRWKGKDFVALCSMLGFQDVAVSQSSSKLMDLPAVWSGPLGWMQFRASAEGCIVEYRPNRHDGLPTMVSWETRRFFEQQSEVSMQVLPRAWLSINILYVGEEKGALWLGPITSVQTRRGVLPYASIKSNVVPTKKSPGKAAGETKSGQETEPERKKLELLEPNDGLMYVFPEGTWADSRGLKWRNNGVKEYSRRYIYEDQFPQDGSLYRLGPMCMDKELTLLIKDAILMLKPDNFYCCPGYGVNSDLCDFFRHVEPRLDSSAYIFSDSTLNSLRSRILNCKTVDENIRFEDELLLHTFVLSNAIHHCTPTQRAAVHLDDVKRLSKASLLMKSNLGCLETAARDFKWALIISPMLFEDVLKWFVSKEFKIGEVLEDGNCVTISHDPASGDLGTVKITASRKLPNEWPHDRLKGTYSVPFVNKAVLDGRTVLKVYLDLLLTYFWIRKLRIIVTRDNNINHYDTTIPFSIIMV